MAADDYEIETDEDPVFAAIAPKKINKWGVAALFAQFASDVTFSLGDLLTAIGGVLTRRYLYEDQKTTFAVEAGKEIADFQGFYIVSPDEEETD